MRLEADSIYKYEKCQNKQHTSTKTPAFDNDFHYSGKTKVIRYFREQQRRWRQTEPRKSLEQIAVCKFLIETFCFTFVLQDSDAAGSVNSSTGENSKERS